VPWRTAIPSGSKAEKFPSAIPLKSPSNMGVAILETQSKDLWGSRIQASNCCEPMIRSGASQQIQSFECAVHGFVSWITLLTRFCGRRMAKNAAYRNFRIPGLVGEQTVFGSSGIWQCRRTPTNVYDRSEVKIYF
jgi:hypothetical protein